MEAAKNLRRPANWQDFESLCKKLWGEIWNYPEIQKNGRLGQEQSGVDVFGIPFGETEYYGIQCKGKSEYNDSQFTEKEIIAEIENAKAFEPKLKKYYLATTAQNDSNIQAFVRKINIEHINKGEFEVHIFGWESIVDLIDENKQTHDWYLKNQNYKTSKGVKISFNDSGSDALLAKPLFMQTNYTYVHQSEERDLLYANPLIAIMKKQEQLQRAVAVPSSFTPKINKSYIAFDITVENTGSDPIEEYKISLQFEGEVIHLTDEEPITNNYRAINFGSPNIVLWDETKTGKIIPRNTILVGDDHIITDKIYLKPAPKKADIIIHWKLVSKDFKDSGQLKIEIDPVINVKKNTIFVEDHSKVGSKTGAVEDVLLNK